MSPPGKAQPAAGSEPCRARGQASLRSVDGQSRSQAIEDSKEEVTQGFSISFLREQHGVRALASGAVRRGSKNSSRWISGFPRLGRSNRFHGRIPAGGPDQQLQVRRFAGGDEDRHKIRRQQRVVSPRDANRSAGGERRAIGRRSVLLTLQRTFHHHPGRQCGRRWGSIWRLARSRVRVLV